MSTVTEAAQDAVAIERQRAHEIGALGELFGLKESSITRLVREGTSIDKAREMISTELASISQQDSAGRPYSITEHVSMVRDETATRFACMEAALLLRYNPQFGLSRQADRFGNAKDEFLKGYGPEYQNRLEQLGREYRAMSLLEMAKDALRVQGLNARGMSRNEI